MNFQISKCDKINNFVSKSWWDKKDRIKKEFIINSFGKSGITLKMDRSEDDLFEYPNELDDKNFTYNIIDDVEEKK